MIDATLPSMIDEVLLPLRKIYGNGGLRRQRGGAI
jgi:hypothetical protein